MKKIILMTVSALVLGVAGAQTAAPAKAAAKPAVVCAKAGTKAPKGVKPCATKVAAPATAAKKK